jgi:prepilin-type N-terminal cleavage/methylation domain-containing protein
MASRTRRWVLLVIALSVIPLLGAITTHRIFYVRDLSFFFWSRHLWLRHTIFSGHAPWWDPYVAGGQSAISDALNQLAMPVALAVRLLPSDVVSFNLWVALPLPIAITGMFVFLRRYMADAGQSRNPDAAAAIGACAFALSGPIVSMLNLPNLAWSVAFVPWVMSAVGARTTHHGSRIATIAVVFALQALCGEPVTWAATGVLALAYRPRLSTIGGLAGGALLAAVQLVPTFAAGVRAHRAALATPDFWSLHPLSLWESIAPQLFGNYYDAFLGDLPWMGALNFGRDPFFYSLYVGPLVLLLAGVGVTERPRRSLLWIAAFVAFTIAALGGYTPIYPLLRRLVPTLMYFRFPVKYIVFAAFAIGVLVAEGWDALATGLPLRRYGAAAVAVILGAAGLLIGVYAVLSPPASTRAAHALAVSTHLNDPAAGAEFLARVAPPLLMRASVLLLAGGIFATLVARHRRVMVLIGAAMCADLLIANGGLNLTADLAEVTPPRWFTSAAGAQRLYIGGRVRGYMNGNDPDGVSTWQIPAESTALEGRMELNALLPMAPSGWRVREALSYDLPYLWPSQYDETVRRFERADPLERGAFLRRSGVRWCVVSAAQHRGWRVVADVSNWNMRVYDCYPDATRVFIASRVTVAEDPSNEDWQREALFDPAQPDDGVRLAVMPAPSGRAGVPGSPSVRFVRDDPNEVILDASVAQPSMVVLRDTFDPSWKATVDGVPATIARANGIYRAVAVPSGHHTVEFKYRPRDMFAGLSLSMMAILGIGFIGFRKLLAPKRNSRNTLNDGGFTLLELMVVLAIIAILLAMAFNEYRGMQAKGNEASAVASMRSISVAQWQFALTCARGRYATTLDALGQAVPQTGHAFVSPDLAQPNIFEKSGYKFQMAAKAIENVAPACNGAPVADGYAATADPAKPGITGRVFFAVNADRIIFVDEEKSFTGNMPETGAPEHGVELKRDVK